MEILDYFCNCFGFEEVLFFMSILPNKNCFELFFEVKTFKQTIQNRFKGSGKLF